MGRETKQSAMWWIVFARGSLLGLGGYLAGCLLTALLLVQGWLPERAMLPAVTVLCAAAAWASGRYARSRTSLGPLPAALLGGTLFAGEALLLGLLFWHEIAWQGSGGVLLTGALAGGAAAGLTKGKKRRKNRPRRGK